MSWLDRFNSDKGKKTAGPTTAPVRAGKKSGADKDKQAFAAVPTGQAAAKKDTAAPAKKSESTHSAFRVLLAPVITEKSTLLGKDNQYVFAVSLTATKIDVRRAVQHVYGIRPLDVTMVRLPGKIVRYGRTTGRTAIRKKAVVTLPAGKTIDLTVS